MSGARFRAWPLRRRTSASDEPLLFGVANSDHQCEAYDPACPDIWDVWERQAEMTPRGLACDFRNRYREDVELARSLGCRLFRFSVAWSRVEPVPGEWSDAAFEHYRDLIACIREAGMEPVITLSHWTWPVHVEEYGGMAGDAFPDLFRRYAAEAARRLGAGVRFWITINEPNALPFGYFKFAWQREYPMPPGLDGDATPTEQVAATAACIRNLFRAHAAAREEIRRLHPEAKVGANPCVLGLPEWFQRWADRQLTSLRDQEEWVRCEELSRDARPLTRNKGGLLTRLKHGLEEFQCKVRSFATLSNTNWWYLGMAGRLPTFLCPPECVGTQDYVALDYYWGISTLRIPRLVRLIEAMQQKFARAPVWPGGLYQAIRHHARLFPGMEILITENGCPDTADGYSRVKYLVSHVKEVVRARRRGMPVVGYLYWSITTCREWGLECGPASDFGLFHIELDGDPELKRVPTAAAETYRALITRYGHPSRAPAAAPLSAERRSRASASVEGR